MAEDRENGPDRDVPRTSLRTAGGSSHRPIGNGPNDRAIDENIAGTAPGIPDDALAPGEELPEPPGDEEVERMAEKLGARDKAGASRH